MKKKAAKKVVAKPKAVTKSKPKSKYELVAKKGESFVGWDGIRGIIDSFASLSPTDRMKLYKELQTAINHDQNKFSQGIDPGRSEYDKLIATYGNS